MPLKFGGISWHSYRSTNGHAMRHAWAKESKARLPTVRSGSGMVSKKSPMLRWAASDREIRPDKRRTRSACHSKMSTKSPKAGSTVRSGWLKTVQSAGNNARARRLATTCACNASSVMGARNAQRNGFPDSRRSLGSSSTLPTSRISATSRSSSAVPDVWLFAATFAWKSSNNGWRYWLARISSHLPRESKFSRSHVASRCLHDCSAVGAAKLARRMCRPMAKSSSLQLKVSASKAQSLTKCSPMYFASASPRMVHTPSVPTKPSKTRGIAPPARAAKPQNIEPWSKSRTTRAALP
mmetsp:Transcript_34895/g.100486  ORF Transcript_34895/g.100486 Transcript_34895/m.100486 type:complete len:296 (+) Transcript_34895:1014-1901(+)